MKSLCGVAVLALLACGGPNKPGGGKAGAAAGDAAFDALADELFDKYIAQQPSTGVSLGLHEHDGRLPDVTPAGLAARASFLKDAIARLDAVDRRSLSKQRRLDRELFLAELRDARFKLVELDEPHKNPMYYSGALDLMPYIARDYAPLHQRVDAIIAICGGASSYLAQARANVEPAMPRTFLDTALLQTRGTIEFINQDVRTAINTIDVPLRNAAQANDALDQCVTALAEHATWLEQQKPRAHDDFAIGEANFLAMLEATQGLEIDLASLRAIAEADLARNLAAIEAAAKAIDPTLPVRDVVLAAAEDRPAAADVLSVATDQTAAMRAFVLAHKIVTVPSDDVAEVRETPPFLRSNGAALDTPGPFEEKAFPSFYFIAPPDPAWTAEEQREYIIPRADLLFTTVHEVWPGHFLHHLWLRRQPSRVARSFCTYTMVEGWAHYTEEMMWDAGAAGDSPSAHIGQLKEALLRNARVLAAIGLHTGEYTVDEAAQLFRDKGFVDAANARQQAVRGTFDPMYVSYTLGKLMIMELQADWKARKGADFSLGGFHDELLSHGCAPLPAIRREMLGDDSGAPLSSSN